MFSIIDVGLIFDISKIIFFIIYWFLFLIMILNNLFFVKKIFGKSIIFFLNKIRFFSPWEFFSDIDEKYYDIVITAISDKNIYVWRLREAPKIADIDIKHNLSRLTLTFYYRRWFGFILNKYFLDEATKFILKKSEIIKGFKIEEIWYNSFNEEIKLKNPIFDWQA